MRSRHCSKLLSFNSAAPAVLSEQAAGRAKSHPSNFIGAKERRNCWLVQAPDPTGLEAQAPGRSIEDPDTHNLYFNFDRLAPRAIPGA